MKESFPQPSHGPEIEKEPSIKDKMRKVLKVLGVSSLLFSAVNEIKAQVRQPITTTNQLKINKYLDSLDVYNDVNVPFFEERSKIQRETTEKNKNKKESEKISYEEKIEKPFNTAYPIQGTRTGIPILPAYRMGIKQTLPTGITTSFTSDLYKQPVQPYLAPVKPERKHPFKKIKKLPLDPLKQTTTEIKESHFSEVSIPEIPVFAPELEGYYLKIYDFDPTLKNPNQPHVVYFQSEKERQDWIKENSSHLQRRGGIDFLDTDTIPNKER